MKSKYLTGNTATETVPEVAMILAAGFGERMLPLTQKTPKPLIKVEGKPLLDYCFAWLNDYGIKKIIINTYYLADQIIAYINTKTQNNVYISHEKQKLETGGGIKNALPLIGTDPFFVINADSIWRGTSPLACLKAVWDPHIMDCLILLIPIENALAYTQAGDFFLDSKGLVLGKGKNTQAPFVYTGVQIVKPELFALIDQENFSLTILLKNLIEKKMLFGTIYNGGWIDVGTPAKITEAERLVSNDRERKL
jgi:MurNAc alpha-1-phosphate uridylyltransferase